MTDEPSASSPEEAAVNRTSEATVDESVDKAGVATTTTAPQTTSTPPDNGSTAADLVAAQEPSPAGSSPSDQPSSSRDGIAGEPPAEAAASAEIGPAKLETAETGTAENAATEEAEPAAGQRPKIQVGSRRGGSTSGLPSTPLLAQPGSKPKEDAEAGVDQAGEIAEQASGTVVPPPTSRTPLPPDLEKAVDDAMADVSIDELISSESADRAAQEIELDSRRPGQVVRVHGDNVFFAIGSRNEGVASVRQFKEPPSIGDEMEVVVKSFQPDDGLYELGIPGAAVAVSDWSDLTEGAVIAARITGANTGGLECMVGQIRGFIPSSQIALFRVQDFAEYIGQKLDCVVTEVNPKRRNLVLSHRALLERQKAEARAELLEKLEPGQIVEGVVRNLRDFGAFVDIGGLDGLIHISQLSWERVNHPRDVLGEGQKVRVRIEKINPQTGKIGLSYRDLLEHPWSKVEEEMTVGNTVRGPVTRIAKFGAFVKLASGVEGLIHISELAHHRVRQVSDVVAEGQDVEVKILSIDTESQRIALSLKAMQSAPEPAMEESEQAQAEQSPAMKRKRKKPLKGGFDRPTGGEEFGLKW